MGGPKIFERHRQKMECFQAITSEPQSTFQLRSTMNSLIDAGSSSTSKERSEREAEEESQNLSSSSYSNDNESNQTDDHITKFLIGCIMCQSTPSVDQRQKM